MCYFVICHGLRSGHQLYFLRSDLVQSLANGNVQSIALLPEMKRTSWQMTGVIILPIKILEEKKDLSIPNYFLQCYWKLGWLKPCVTCGDNKKQWRFCILGIERTSMLSFQMKHANCRNSPMHLRIRRHNSHHLNGLYGMSIFNLAFQLAPQAF